MITNYIKIAFRNFYLHKSITFIKILGLALGLAVTFFILFYISTETSYNNFHQNKERIFVINNYDYLGGWKSRETCYPLRDAIINEMPEIQLSTRLIKFDDFSLKKENDLFSESKMICVDKEFFDIFTIIKKAGSFERFTDNDLNIAISESAALKYFGSIDIINRPIDIIIGNRESTLNIVAVFKDLPKLSTVKANFIATTEFGVEQLNAKMMWSDGVDREADFYRKSWDSSFLETYILLKNKNQANGFDKKLNDVIKKHESDPTYEQDFYIQNLSDIYLKSADMLDKDEMGDLNSIIIFATIALLVLIIACINYIILSVTQIINRTKEVSVRKILGAKQSDLFKQISVESVIMILITLPIAFIFIEQFRPIMEEMIRKQFMVTYNWKLLFGLIGIIGFVVFVPGLNIMHYLNRISSISIFQKSKNISLKKFSMRKLLIIFQYVIFIVLIVLALGIRNQINFITKSDLGFNPKNKVVLQVVDYIKNGKYQTLKNELLKYPEVENVSAAMWLPPSTGKMMVDYSDTTMTESIQLEALFVDHDFIETFDIDLIEGQSLSEYNGSDGLKVIANQQACKLMGDDIIGKKFWGGDIVGVASDFRFHSANEIVKPMVLIAGGPMMREMVINLKDEINESFLNKLTEDLVVNFPDLDTDFEILTERFDKLYNKEKRQAKLIGIYSFLAIFIASIGLLGLTISTAQKQTKSIAIRKVNGATTTLIWKLLISGYVRLIAIAFIIAAPFAYYFLNKWLQSFSYKTNIAWWIFVLSAVLAILISLITVSWYSIKAARKNPVNSLRYE